jgi:hypothetical protein
MPLRLALTGVGSGPELADLLPLIGGDKSVPLPAGMFFLKIKGRSLYRRFLICNR